MPGLVFEISTTAKNMERAAKKAPLLTAAGVRRVFCLLLEGGPTLFEWDARARKFVSLREDAVIEDPLLAHPIPVRRVLDAKGAQIAIHDLNEAHDAEGEKRGLVKGEQVGLVKGEQIGLAKGLRVAVLGILEDRVLAVSEALRQRIVAEQSPEQLIQWRKRALHVARAEEIL